MTINLRISQGGGSKLKEIIKMMRNVVKVSVLKETSVFGVREEYVNKSEAYRRYGRSTVDRWLKEGLIIEYKTAQEINSLKLAELEKVASRSNRISYLPVSER